MKQDQKIRLQQLGWSSMSSIAALVSAMSVDFERLDELVSKKFSGKDAMSAEQWALNSPEEAAELTSIQQMATPLGVLCESHDDVSALIQHHVKKVEVRSDWRPIDSPMTPPVEYRLQISTGGAAVRIVGTLAADGQPETSRLQVAEHHLSWWDCEIFDQDLLLQFSRCFFVR